MARLVILLSPVVEVLLYLAASMLLIGLGVVAGYFLFKVMYKRAGKTAQKIIEEAKKAAEENRKAIILETKQELYNLRQETEREIREKKKEAAEFENRLLQREERLENRNISLDRREEALNQKERLLDERKAELENLYSKVEDLKAEQERKLVEISGLSVEEAKAIIMDRIEQEMSMEIAAYIKDEEEKAKTEVKRRVQCLLANAMQQYASDIVNEKTVSVVALPNDEMKGRIIGREGRNIRAIEATTGVDLIIDDTPEAVVISSFDPIRREIAKRTLEMLVADGRIQPPRIEEVVSKVKKELDAEIREYGEKAIFETGIGRVHPELVKLLGRLKFRTSYGQNALSHSIEVAFLAGKLAAEIGLNEIHARRAGLLHDIGKAADHEMEGSHVEIGLELAKRYKEPNYVLDAIASHHGDKEPETIIAHLVAAADTLSAARPGARSESLENYLKRLSQLEEICNEFQGVEKTYAVQAGREVRILVKPEEIDDLQAYKLARDIRQKIENEMNYPGTIKVTVIRETRVHEVAK